MTTNSAGAGRIAASDGVARWIEHALSIFFFAVYCGVAVTIVLALDKGFDVHDEAFHVVMTLFPEQSVYHFTQFGYLAHGLFGWLSPDVLTLRYIALAFNLAGTAIFFAGFLAWVRASLPGACRNRFEILGLLGVIGLSNLAFYLHFPRSLQYNGINQFLVVAAAGAMLYVLRPGARDDRAARRDAWAFFGLGFIVALDVVVKFSTAASLLLAVVGMVAVLRATNRTDWRTVAIHVAAFVGGVVMASLLFWAIAMSPLEVVRRVALTVEMESLSPHRGLLSRYTNQVRSVAIALRGEVLLPLAIGLGGLWLLARDSARRRPWLRWAALAVAAVAMLAYYDWVNPRWTLHKLSFPAFWAGLTVAMAFWSVVLLRRPGKASLVAIFTGMLLFMLPVGGSVGTANPLHFGTLPYLAVWTALMLIVLLAIRERMPQQRWLSWLATAFIVIVLARSIVMIHGRSARGLGRPALNTATLEGMPALERLRVYPDTANVLNRARRAVQSVPGFEPGDPVMTIYKWPVMVLATGGSSPGVPWYFDQRHRQNYNCAILRLVDAPLDRLIIIQNRRLWEEFARCLRAKGVRFPDDYQLVDKFGKFKVWAPRRDGSGG